MPDPIKHPQRRAETYPGNQAGTLMVTLRHSRTEQLVTVPLARYQQQAGQRYRNWRLARGNSFLRPPITMSQIVMGAGESYG